MIKNGCCDTKIFVFVHKSYTKCAPYFECLSGMENVINKPCLCQLEQAICCLPKPLSEQRKQIFLVERGAESPTGADWSCVLSSTVPLHLPLLESVGKRSHPRRRDTFLCGRQENVCYLPVTVAQPKDETRMGQIRHMHACKQTPYAHLHPPHSKLSLLAG